MGEFGVPSREEEASWAMGGEGRLDETVMTPEEWEGDPFSAAAVIIKEACDRALSYEGAMNNTERSILVAIKELVS